MGKSNKRILKDKSSKIIRLPRWLVVIIPAIIAVVGIYTIYNTYAFQEISTEWNITSEPTRVYIHCSEDGICYNGGLLTTTQVAAFVRTTQNASCVSGFQYTDVLQGNNTKWKCLEIAGD